MNRLCTVIFDSCACDGQNDNTPMAGAGKEGRRRRGFMNEKGGVVSNIKALSARCVDSKTSVVGCSGGGFFCLVWIRRCNIWCRQYVGPAMICDRYG